MSDICPRCKEHFCRLYFGAEQEDGSYICYDCHCAEMYELDTCLKKARDINVWQKKELVL
jgi:hypothetical protein